MERTSHRVLTALLVAIVSIPVTTQAIFRLPEGVEFEEVRTHRSSDWRAQRRAYARAVEEYRRKLHEGDEAAVMPDINDSATYENFLSPEALPEVQPSDRQRLILRRHTRAKRCPPEMEKIMPGFYDLCMSIVGEDAKSE